jgi:hypothetical protein
MVPEPCRSFIRGGIEKGISKGTDRKVHAEQGKYPVQLRTRVEPIGINADEKLNDKGE